MRARREEVEEGGAEEEEEEEEGNGGEEIYITPPPAAPSSPPPCVPPRTRDVMNSLTWVRCLICWLICRESEAEPDEVASAGINNEEVLVPENHEDDGFGGDTPVDSITPICMFSTVPSITPLSAPIATTLLKFPIWASVFWPSFRTAPSTPPANTSPSTPWTSIVMLKPREAAASEGAEIE